MIIAPVTEARNPMLTAITEMTLPCRCLCSITNISTPAAPWTNREEKRAQRKIQYHISERESKVLKTVLENLLEKSSVSTHSLDDHGLVRDRRYKHAQYNTWYIVVQNFNNYHHYYYWMGKSTSMTSPGQSYTPISSKCPHDTAMLYYFLWYTLLFANLLE